MLWIIRLVCIKIDVVLTIEELEDQPPQIFQGYKNLMIKSCKVL